jgi:hypothetical protein
MGEQADYIIDQMIDGWFDTGRRKRLPGFQSGVGKGRWRRADCAVVNMADMTAAHLEAALAVCKAKGNTGKAADLEAALAKKIAAFFTPPEDENTR